VKIQIQNLNIKINLRQAPNHIDQDHLKQKPLLRIKKTVQAAQVQVMTKKRMTAQLRNSAPPLRVQITLTTKSRKFKASTLFKLKSSNYCFTRQE